MNGATRCSACLLLLASLARCGSDPEPAKVGTATCEAQVDRESEACGGAADEGRSSFIEDCEQSRARFVATGCGPAYDAWLGCTTAAKWDCEEGPSGCDSAQDEYFRCQSRFVQRTGCTALAGNDEECPSSAPNSFTCLTSNPPGNKCVRMSDTGGSAADLFCCPG